MGESSKKGLEGTGLNLPVNRHGNLKSASSDQNLLEILGDTKASKTSLPTMAPHDIDECAETTLHICYTPTFHFYSDVERVDEMFGAGEERLHDRMWLHS